MPTLLTERGFRIVIYFNDHSPAHVHVKRAGHEAKFTLDPVGMLDNYGFNQNEIKLITEIVEKHQTMLLEAWRSYYGDEDED
jgi:hypothetical protein